MEKLIIQAHVNEGVKTTTNPNVPMTAEDVAADAVACAEAGAAIVHFHARTEDEGQAPSDLEFYREAASRFRSETDILWYPPQGFAPTPDRRWAHVPPLVEDPETALELIVIDPGSVDMMSRDPDSGGFVGVEIMEDMMEASVGTPPTPPLDHWLWFCNKANALGLKPIFGIFEPGYLQRVLMWVEDGLIHPPLAIYFIVSEVMGFGPPPRIESIQFYLDMIPEDVKTIWFVTPYGCKRATEERLFTHAISHGGHIRAGLGTPPLDGYARGAVPTNADAIRAVVAMADALDRPVATVSETREILGIGG